MEKIDPWFLDNLVCPVDKLSLKIESGNLACPKGHLYHVFDGIPVMLQAKVRPTGKKAYSNTMKMILESNRDKKEFSSQKSTVLESSEFAVDSFVQRVIGLTNSNLYRHLTGRLKEYPIPELNISPGNGKYFLDIGCNWGRWCIAAGKIGYYPVGIDPNLEAILAAYRVARQLGVQARYLVADSTYLPFPHNIFDIVYSYGVFQHFDKQAVRESFIEIHRVLSPHGNSVIQMLNTLGLRSFHVQIKRRFREARDFETRYWFPRELLSAASKTIGPSKLIIGSFFTQGQPSDKHLFLLRHRSIVNISEFLKLLNSKIHFLTNFADNLFVISEKKLP